MGGGYAAAARPLTGQECPVSCSAFRPVFLLASLRTSVSGLISAYGRQCLGLGLLAATHGGKRESSIPRLFEKQDRWAVVPFVPIHVNLMNETPLNTAVLVEGLDGDPQKFGGLPGHGEFSGRKTVKEVDGCLCHQFTHPFAGSRMKQYVPAGIALVQGGVGQHERSADTICEAEILVPFDVVAATMRTFHGLHGSPSRG